MEGFKKYKEKSIYDLMYTRLSYGSIWLKLGYVRQILVKASHIQFEEN
jgi:hypothetical protein